MGPSAAGPDYFQTLEQPDGLGLNCGRRPPPIVFPAGEQGWGGARPRQTLLPWSLYSIGNV